MRHGPNDRPPASAATRRGTRDRREDGLWRRRANGREAGGTGEETTFDNGLECTGGMAVGGTSDYAPGAEGEEAGPVEQTRRAFSGQIREGDRVGLSTTPQRGDQRTVRVVREGRTVALIVYHRAGGDWLRDSYDACAGFAGF